ELLRLLARCFHRGETPDLQQARARQQERKPKRGSGNRPGGGTEWELKPGDDFDRRGPDWAELLTPHGWTVAGDFGQGGCYLKRPGKTEPGHSATAGVCQGGHGEPLLYVFSSNAQPFEPNQAYGKFRAVVVLKYNGDFKEAAKD